MKNILLTLGLIISAQSVYAQPVASPANITEAEFHPYQIWDIYGWYDSSNSNAHSHGNLFINGSYRDLYVFTWDNAMGIGGDGGFAVWQMPAGVSVENGTSGSAVTDFKSAMNGDFFNPYQEIRSLEAGILNDGSTTYIALTYYSSGFYLALYEWDGISLGPPSLYLLTGAGIGVPPEGWIHQDVNNLGKIVITWEYEGKVFTKAGEMTATGLNLGNTAQLYENTGVYHEFKRPDVAMMKETSTKIALYYVVETADETELFVYKGYFDDLYTIPNNTPPELLYVDPLYSRRFSGPLGLPRIDAPDNALNRNMDGIWSCTVAEHTGSQDFIWGVVRDPLGNIAERPLNDGSLVVCGLCDLTPSNNPDTFNRRPTVAFSNDGRALFYAWSFRNPEPLNQIQNQNATYLSVKTTLDLQLLNMPSDRYFQIPQSNVNTDFTPSVALSTQNDASPQLFTSFLQWPYNPFTYDYYIGLKTVDWSTTSGYKPGSNTDISDVNDDYNISIAPNPFHNGFQISLKGPSRQAYTLSLFNILGKKVYKANGTLEELNRKLGHAGKQLNSGTYFMELKSEEGAVFRKEIVKW